MKVLLAILHHSVFGGPHNQLLRLAAPLASRGWETVVILPKDEGNAADRLRGAGIRVIQAPLHRPRKTIHLKPNTDWVLGFLPEIQSLRRIIREERADVVQVAGPMYLQGAIASNLEKVPVVWQLLGLFTPYLLRCLSMPFVLSLSEVVMTTGRAVARAHPGALSLGRGLVPFYPPVDTHEFRPDAARRKVAREELRVPSDALVVGTVGNFIRQKGHDLLVQSAELVQRKQPHAVFRILGTPIPSHTTYYNEHVKEQAARLGLLWDDNFMFVEPGDRVCELLPAFDIFVMPSRIEGIPTSVLEAMACGLPVIATDVGAVREVIDDGSTGRVVEPEDCAAIADAIIELLENQSARTQMGARARRRAVERYDLTICADTHQMAYDLAQSGRAELLRARASEKKRIPGLRA